MERLACLLTITALLTGTLTAQWVQTNGPYGGGFINSVALQDSFLFIGTGSAGLYRATDENPAWEYTSLSDTGNHVYAIGAIAVNGTNIFTSTSGGVFLSTDHGDAWTHLDNGLSEVSAIVSSGATVFAGTWGGDVYRSTDNGGIWSPVVNGLADGPVSSLVVSGSNVFAATLTRGIYVSTNLGELWTPVNDGLTDTLVTAMAVSGGYLFAGTWQTGVFRSTDDGAHWTKVKDANIYALAAGGTALFAGGSGVFKTTDHGTTWTSIEADRPMNTVYALAASQDGLIAGTRNGVFVIDSTARLTPRNMGLPITTILSLVGHNGRVFAGTEFVGIFTSTNRGQSWTEQSGGLSALSIYDICSVGNDLFYGSSGGVYVSSDNGLSWAEAYSGLPGPVSALTTQHSILFAGTSNGVFASTDRGTQWAAKNEGMEGVHVKSFTVMDDKIYAGTYSGEGVYSSSDHGKSWVAVNPGMIGSHVYALAVCDGRLYAGTHDGVFQLSETGSSWIHSLTYPVEALAVIQDKIFAGTSGGGIRLSTDHGTTWLAVNTGLTQRVQYSRIHSLTIFRGDLYAGTYANSVWRRPLSEMIPNPIITVVSDVPSDQGGRVSLSWAATSLDTNINTLPYYSVWRSISQVPQTALNTQSMPSLTPDFKGPAYRATIINGTEYAWEWIGNQPAHRCAEYSYSAPTLYDSVEGNTGMHYFLVSAHTSDPNVFHDSNVDSGYSMDNLSPSPPENLTGNHAGNAFMLRWDANAEPDMHHYEIYRSGNPGFNPDTMTSLSAVESTNFTDNLMLPIPTYYYVVRAVDIHGNRSAKSAEVSTVLVGVEEAEALPTEYALSQNYPNPFNPVTSISYALPAGGHVRLSVFNMLGQEIIVLVDGEQGAGYKTVEFNAKKLPSGVYAYKLVAGTFTDFKRMVFLK